MIELKTNLSINHISEVLNCALKFLDRSIKTENISEEWRSPKFREELLNLINQVNVWESNGIDLIDFGITDFDDTFEESEYWQIPLNYFKMYLTIGGKWIIDFLENGNGVSDDSKGHLHASLNEFLDLLKEIQEIQSDKRLNWSSPLINFLLSSSDDFYFDDQDYW